MQSARRSSRRSSDDDEMFNNAHTQSTKHTHHPCVRVCRALRRRRRCRCRRRAQRITRNMTIITGTLARTCNYTVVRPRPRTNKTGKPNKKHIQNGRKKTHWSHRSGSRIPSAIGAIVNVVAVRVAFCVVWPAKVNRTAGPVTSARRHLKIAVTRSRTTHVIYIYDTVRPLRGGRGGDILKPPSQSMRARDVSECARKTTYSKKNKKTATHTSSSVPSHREYHYYAMCFYWPHARLSQFCANTVARAFADSGGQWN